MIVLTVHIDQRLRYLLEHVQSNRIAIETEAGSSAGMQGARDEQFPTVLRDGKSGGRFNLAKKRGVLQFAEATDAAFVRARSQHLRPAAKSEQQLNRADHQALAGAGCPRKAIQP